MENINVNKKYDVELDYFGYIIEPASFRITPASLFGTRFTRGRPEYSGLDLWQIGALTDFSKGMGQDFLVDPSRFSFSEGIDITTPGEIKLERDLVAIDGDHYPASKGKVTAHYRSASAIYLGTEDGNILKSTDGVTFTQHQDTGAGKIYQFYEVDDALVATKGAKASWFYSDWQKIFSYPSTNKDGSFAIGNKYQYGQTFQPTASNKIVKMIKAYMLSMPGKATGNLECAIYELDGSHLPTGDPVATAEHGPLTNFESYAWVTFRFSEAITLDESTEYGMVFSVIGGADESALVGRDESSPSDAGRAIEYDGETYTVSTTEACIYEIWNQEGSAAWAEIGPVNLYFVSVESQIIYGYFNDGVRQSEDGLIWVPEPPDPLWALPSGDGVPLSALTIPRGFLLGTSRGLWMISAGSSGYAIREFTGQVSTDNFRGFGKYDYFGIFSVENEGILYTDGKATFVTNIDSKSNSFAFRSCAGIEIIGQDIFALVKNSDDEWYLARSNQRYFNSPTHFTMVKKLTKTPYHLSTYGTATVKKVFIHYEDETTDVLDLLAGVYQTSGWLETSKIDEDLIRLQKMYRVISCVLSDSPASAKVSIAYAKDNEAIGSYEDNTLTATTVEVKKTLDNGTTGNRIKIRVKLTKTGISTPVVSDITWKYILERPSEETTSKKNFTFTIIAEDEMACLDNSDFPYTRRELMDNIWDTKDKKQILNFVGLDNKEEDAIKITHTSGYTVTIDQVDSTIKLYNASGVLDHSLSSNQTLTAIVVAITGYSGYTCVLSPDATGTDSGTTLMPVSSISIKGGRTLKSGDSIHKVIITSGTPAETHTSSEGAGSARINLSLREI